MKLKFPASCIFIARVCAVVIWGVSWRQSLTNTPAGRDSKHTLLNFWHSPVASFLIITVDGFTEADNLLNEVSIFKKEHIYDYTQWFHPDSLWMQLANHAGLYVQFLSKCTTQSFRSLQAHVLCSSLEENVQFLVNDLTLHFLLTRLLEPKGEEEIKNLLPRIGFLATWLD